MKKFFRFLTSTRFAIIDLLFWIACILLPKDCPWYAPLLLIIICIIISMYIRYKLRHSVGGKWIMRLYWDGTGDLSISREEMHKKLDELINEQVIKS